VEAVLRRLGIGDCDYVLLLGPWVRRKNLGVVVEAFRLLAERLPGVKLVITGRPTLGMKSGDMSSVLSRLPPDARCATLTVGHLPVEDLRAVMQGAAALAYPSLYEGFGLPPLEAMAAGTPAVVSDTPAVLEAAGGAALVAPSRDPQSWAQALHRIITDPDLAASLRQAGRERSLRFSWTRCSEETLDLYDRIVAGD
jgi:glycosyltransferase involved in cell wall biosynthesis